MSSCCKGWLNQKQKTPQLLVLFLLVDTLWGSIIYPWVCLPLCWCIDYLLSSYDITITSMIINTNYHKYIISAIMGSMILGTSQNNLIRCVGAGYQQLCCCQPPKWEEWSLCCFELMLRGWKNYWWSQRWWCYRCWWRWSFPSSCPAWQSAPPAAAPGSPPRSWWSTWTPWSSLLSSDLRWHRLKALSLTL